MSLGGGRRLNVAGGAGRISCNEIMAFQMDCEYAPFILPTSVGDAGLLECSAGEGTESPLDKLPYRTVSIEFITSGVARGGTWVNVPPRHGLKKFFSP